MNIRTIAVLAKAEMRSCRKLARTWVFVCIALSLCTLWYFLDLGGVYQTWWPEAPSGWSNYTIAPQYDTDRVLFIFGIIFSIGIIFLCFDIRARDTKNLISEVVDSMPANNLEITIGRVAGILLLLLVPILLFVAAVTCYEVLAHFLGLSYRYGLTMVAITWGTVFNTMIFLAFCGSVVSCLAVLVRNRLLVALISLGLLYGLVWLSEQPFFQLEDASIHSDLVSAPFTTSSLVLPLSLLLLSFAFLAFASSLLPRTQPRRQFLGIGGTICLAAGILSLSGLIALFDKPDRLRQEWIALHNSEPTEAFPDILHLRGIIDLFPNKYIQFDLTLTVIPPASNPTDSVVFSLNPGYRIQNVHIDGHEVVDFTFEHGLLKVDKSEWAKDVHQLRITAQGIPNEHFAYLDQARKLSEKPSIYTSRFGTENYIFSPDFVALMPSVNWYPTSGTATHTDLLEVRPRDVFTTHLTVSVPELWKVAMVGNRELVTGAHDGNELRTSFRFESKAPVPELALISSNFDQRGKTIEGIGFELLFSKKHTKNLGVLAPYVNDIEEWVTEQINDVRKLSLEYPYGSFYVVEVPSTLRIYGGGWRMDSVLHPPGMMLVRESSFPTANFELFVRDEDLGEEMQVDAFIRRMMVSYFRDDLQGGSPFAGISRNFVNHLSSPSGRGSTAINYLLEQLSTQLIMKEEYLFVPSLWEFRVRPEQADQSDFSYYSGRAATRKRLDLLRTPSTWEEIERTPLIGLDFRSKPILGFRVLLTKSYALAKQMIEYYGTEKVSAFLNRLTSTYEGHNYSLEDFVAVAAESDIDLNDWVLDWLETKTLPGFIVADLRVSKLRAEEYSPYQTTFIIHNAEPIAGYVEISWNHDERGISPYPIFLHGHQSVEIAIETDVLLHWIRIRPNFARNREQFSVRIPEFDGVSVSDNPMKPFMSAIEWFPEETKSIVVDDLDPGFSIVGQKFKKKSNFDFPGLEIGSPVEEFVDQGLPVRGLSIVGEWERKNDRFTYSFGRYRHTLALIARGKRNTYAKFAAELPHSGNWQLDYFVPGRALRGQHYVFGRGSGSILQNSVLIRPRADPNNPDEHYALQIKDGQSIWNEQFDIANAVHGWNKVSTFELASDTVEVLVKDFAGRADVIVFADAIRWTPVDSE